LMTPDPKLDVAFAAVAWGWTIKGTCFDPEAFAAFLDAHYGMGTEVTCLDGTDVVAQGIPPLCGEPGFVPPVP
jgi:hypothetical protein